MPVTENFGLDRKIVASMTSSGWKNIPLVSVLYEMDVSILMDVLKEYNNGRTISETMSFNTAMLKIISEGIKAAPKTNGHIRYSNLFVKGSLTTFEEINVTMPVMIDRDTMMTVNVRGMEKMSMTGIRDSIAGLIRRAKNTHLPTAMYEVGFRDSMKELKKGHVIKAAGRLIGAMCDGSKKPLLRGAEKRRYLEIPESERLTWRDLEQGTVTISNPGTLIKRWNVNCVLLDIIPPQVCAFGINRVDERPAVMKDGSVGISKMTTLNIVFDHRALDGNDLIPFFRRIDEIISSSENIRGLI